MDTDSDPSDNSMEVADIEDWSEESEEIADVDEWSDEDDDEDVRDTNWQSVFEQFQREDTQRDAERAERRRQQQLEEEAAADRARAEAQRCLPPECTLFRVALFQAAHRMHFCSFLGFSLSIAVYFATGEQSTVVQVWLPVAFLFILFLSRVCAG